MKKSVVSAAMLLALGVSGAANAVQMHGVIQGTLAGSTSFDHDLDGPVDLKVKTWGNNSAPKRDDPVRVDFWFNSEMLADYDNKPARYVFSASTAPTESIALSMTYNGVTRALSPTVGWDVQDFWIGAENDKDMVDMNVYEFLGGYESQRKANLKLAFADDSIPVLREAMLGHTVATVSLNGDVSTFYYQGQVGGKTYDSKLTFTPRSFSIAPVPEPETWAMMLLGLGVVGYAARRRAAR